jgi:hypothetical protein
MYENGVKLVHLTDTLANADAAVQIGELSQIGFDRFVSLKSTQESKSFLKFQNLKTSY